MVSVAGAVIIVLVKVIFVADVAAVETVVIIFVDVAANAEKRSFKTETAKLKKAAKKIFIYTEKN